MIIDTLFTNPLVFFVWLIAIIVPIALHEFSHALAATLQGDPTPKSMGRLTLNPIAHIDPLGIILLLLAGFGWGKPTPYNPLYLKSQRWGPVIVAVAGPVSNLIMIVAFGLLLRAFAFLGTTNLMVLLLVALVQINIVLMIFNLIPIPPLDGSKVVFGFLPRSTEQFQMNLERLGPMLLIGLIIIDRFANLGVFSSAFTAISNLIFRVFT